MICFLKLSSEELSSTVSRNLEISISKSRFLTGLKKQFEQVCYTGIELNNEMSSDIISLVRKRRALQPVIILTDTVDVPTAVKWMKIGVDDVLDISRFDQLESSVRKLLPEYQDKIEEQSKGHYLHLIAKHVDDIIFEFDYTPELKQKWRLNYLSPSFETITGYQGKSFLRESDIWATSIHPDDLNDVVDKTRQIIHQGKSLHRKYRMKHGKSGEYIWIEDHLSPVSDENGNVIQLIGIARDINLSQRATQELETKQLLLTEAERMANMGSWKYDVLRENLEVSDSLKSLLGLNGMSHTLGAHFLEKYVPVTEKSKVKAFIESVETNIDSIELEHSLTDSSGAERKVQTTLRSIKGENGELKSLLGSTIDITDHFLHEHKLQESQRFVDSIIETSPSIIYVIDYSTKLMLHGMKRFAEYFGYSSEEIELMPGGVDYLVHPDDLKAIREQENSLAESEKGSVVSTEFRIQDKEGHWIWVLVYSKVFEWDENDKPTKGIGSVVDINKRKESDKKFEAVAENASAGIFIMQNERLIYANPAVAEITGYSLNEMTGIHFLEFLDPSIRKQAANFPKKLSNKRSKRFHSEQMVMRKDGSKCYLEITSTMIDFQTNPAILGVVFDISDRKKSEIERNTLIDRLTKQNKNLEQFSYIISHNLRSPVASILGLTEIVDTSTMTTQNVELFKHIEESTANLDAVIQDLSKTLSVKNIDHEDLEKVTLSEVTASVLQAFEDKIRKTNANVEVGIDQMLSMNTVRSYLQNILYNLISNSIKFRDKNKQLEMKIKARKNLDLVEIEIEDNGLGIDLVVNRDRVFKLYEKFHDTTEGRGIGLYLAKTQVEALNGSIDVLSEIGKGCIFRFKLPLNVSE